MRKTFLCLALLVSLLTIPAVAADAGVSMSSTPEAATGCLPAAATAESSTTGADPLFASIGGPTDQACCQSDPCPGWGSYRVSCCESGGACSGHPTSVYCPSSGAIDCPDPCADNDICNETCGFDPDCCTQDGVCNESCGSDPDCDCEQGAYCTDRFECGPGLCDLFTNTCQCPT